VGTPQDKLLPTAIGWSEEQLGFPELLLKKGSKIVLS
jgi:hypothetical protein